MAGTWSQAAAGLGKVRGGVRGGERGGATTWNVLRLDASFLRAMARAGVVEKDQVRDGAEGRERARGGRRRQEGVQMGTRDCIATAVGMQLGELETK
jgi:hypothetical protein